jgi:polyphosphate kinase 2 (PPK2 family)
MDNLLDLLLQATITLTQGGAIKDRLADAYAAHLIQIDSEDLPEHLRSDFDALCSAMRRERPQPRESEIRASVRKMSNDEAARHAAAVVKIFAGVARAGSGTAVRRVRNPISSPIVNLFAADA